MGMKYYVLLIAIVSIFIYQPSLHAYQTKRLGSITSDNGMAYAEFIGILDPHASPSDSPIYRYGEYILFNFKYGKDIEISEMLHLSWQDAETDPPKLAFVDLNKDGIPNQVLFTWRMSYGTHLSSDEIAIIDINIDKGTIAVYEFNDVAAFKQAERMIKLIVKKSDRKLLLINTQTGQELSWQSFANDEKIPTTADISWSSVIFTLDAHSKPIALLDIVYTHDIDGTYYDTFESMGWVTFDINISGTQGRYVFTLQNPRMEKQDREDKIREIRKRY